MKVDWLWSKGGGLQAALIENEKKKSKPTTNWLLAFHAQPQSMVVELFAHLPRSIGLLGAPLASSAAVHSLLHSINKLISFHKSLTPPLQTAHSLFNSSITSLYFISQFDHSFFILKWKWKRKKTFHSFGWCCCSLLWAELCGWPTAHNPPKNKTTQPKSFHSHFSPQEAQQPIQLIKNKSIFSLFFHNWLIAAFLWAPLPVNSIVFFSLPIRKRREKRKQWIEWAGAMFDCSSHATSSIKFIHKFINCKDYVAYRLTNRTYLLL